MTQNRTYSLTKLSLVATLVGLGGLMSLAPLSDVYAGKIPGVVKATPRVAGNTVRISGRVIPLKQAVLAAQVPGSITYLPGQAGDFFVKGTVLAAVDDSALRAKRKALVAGLMAADAAFRTAQIQYNQELLSPRSGRPTGMGMPSMMDSFMKPFSGQYAGPHDPWVNRMTGLQSRQQGIAAAKNRMDQIRAQIEEIDTRLRDAQLRAPFDGVMVSRHVEKGDTVQPGKPLLDFADVSAMLIDAKVPEKLMNNIKVGDELKAGLDINGPKEVTVQVNQIYPVADRERHTVRVKFALPRQLFGKPVADVVRSGMYAEVIMRDKRHDTGKALPSVPTSAVIWKGSLKAVYICTKNGQRSIRYVTTGERLSSGYVNILAGLTGDELVIVEPTASNAAQICKETQSM